MLSRVPQNRIMKAEAMTIFTEIPASARSK